MNKKNTENNEEEIENEEEEEEEVEGEEVEAEEEEVEEENEVQNKQPVKAPKQQLKPQKPAVEPNEEEEEENEEQNNEQEEGNDEEEEEEAEEEGEQEQEQEIETPQKSRPKPQPAKLRASPKEEHVEGPAISGDDNSFIISLALIKKFSDYHQGDSDSVISDFLKKTGLPMHFKEQGSLALYLYFHKMCIPFYGLFKKITGKDISKSILKSLKESYYLFSDTEIKHFNYESLAQKVFPKMKISQEDSAISRIPVILQDELSQNSSNFEIKKLILNLGFQSNGRLDIYVKIHIIKSLIIYLNDEELLPYIQIFQQMEDDLMKLYGNAVKEKLTQEKYDELVKLFANGEMRNKWKDQLTKLRKSVGVFQNANDTDSLKILEKFFIQLLGHFDKEVRNNAVKVLNMLYDQTTWQEKSAFPLDNTKIKLLDEQLTLEFNIKDSDFANQSIVLITSFPSENPNIKNNCISFLKCQNEEEKDNTYKLIFPLGTLSKCGYYDWYLVRFSKGRFTNIKILNANNEPVEGKGRIIVLNKDIKDLSVHEVFCDLIDADIDKNQGRIIKRGKFENLENKLDELKQRYINCIYIMGALERDNNIGYDEETGEVIDIGNYEASPMAVTSRNNISSLLGGSKAFQSLMNKAHKLKMKIILDSLSRISSSRAHRKYRDVLLRYLDPQGKMQICYGSDGKSVTYGDSAVLNYRKIEAWEMLINEVDSLIEKYKIDGLHLDNCHAWPQIMEIDAAEMYRIDLDGKPAYSPLEILNGEIVMPNAESGYWDTDLSETYANPLLVKLTRNIWAKFPNFVFVGECWLNEKSLQRHVNLTKSGIIPRMYTLPIILCEVLGKKIQRNGNIETVQPNDITAIKTWYEENYQGLPEGAILIQSSTGQVWPYPALLYGRGNWSAVDLLFGLPDIPMTFMDEIDGEAYRVQITNVYESKDGKSSTASNSSSSSGLKTRSKSLLRLIEAKEQEQKESESQEKKPLSRSGSNLNLIDFKPSYDLTESISSLINLSGVAVKEAKEIDNKQNNLVKSLGPEQGFDLTKIKFHYDHHRKLRNDHVSLRRGKIVYLKALDNNGKQQPGVLVFARKSPEETGIFAINFREQESNFNLDLSALVADEKNFNAICAIENWEDKDVEGSGEYFFIRELSQGRMTRKIGPYQSVCFGFKIVPFTEENYKRTMETSNSRMIEELKNKGDTAVDSFQTTLLLKEILNKKLPLEEFSKWVSYICDILSKYNVSFIDYIKKLDFISNDEKLTTEFFRYCFRLARTKNMNLSPQNQKLAQEAENIFNSNVLGPICFITPELGRWSTVGGLGIMVDELSQGLTALGQEVIMISPYYNQNRKGQTGYLANDPFNIHYIRNVSINLDGNYGFGVHYGTGNDGIKYYFLHNADIFPRPYADMGPAGVVRQMACFAKASLQLLCDLGIIPAMVLTNDWFTGLVPAYAKNGAFGDTFRGSTFMHICHNLEPTYEGRLYPSPQEGTLQGIYQFDPNWLIDFSWKQRVINPSRCALMMSDRWATVSNSYKADLRASSPLAYFLNSKPYPFSYPNGIFKAKRLKVLNEKTGGDRNACKKYIQQKYFGYGDADLSVPLFSFVGRITQQKGVLMILDCVEEMIRRTGGKINILVGGMGDKRDPYVGACMGKMWYLRGKYPYAFWADPNEFFTDGPKINKGSDFGLMPSLFEPGGIVQHEFFIASTPVIAFRTGGLKDTVFEFRWDNNSGNGFTFDNYNCGELINAMTRAIDLFKNKEKYEICRKNAFNSAIDVADVARAWCREFYLIKGKLFFNVKEVKDTPITLDDSSISLDNSQYANPNLSKYSNYSNNAASGTSLMEPKNQFVPDIKPVDSSNPNALKTQEPVDPNIVNTTFTYKFHNRNPKTVVIRGSFDEWKEDHPLAFDSLLGRWQINMKLKKGNKYLYKYVVDGKWEINPNEKNEKGNDGNVNNVINL